MVFQVRGFAGKLQRPGAPQEQRGATKFGKVPSAPVPPLERGFLGARFCGEAAEARYAPGSKV